MKRTAIQHHMDGLIALLLFGVFAVCVLAVLLTGANAYRRLTQRDQSAYSRRTCAQYIATRVRQADGRVSVESFGGTDALVLKERQGTYLTRIYCYDGYLMELYCDQEAVMEPRDGEHIMEAGGLALSLTDGLLTASLTGTDGGAEETLYLSLRGPESGPGAASHPGPASEGMPGAAVPSWEEGAMA